VQATESFNLELGNLHNQQITKKKREGKEGHPILIKRLERSLIYPCKTKISNLDYAMLFSIPHYLIKIIAVKTN
jgi:hypothetical protein